MYLHLQVLDEFPGVQVNIDIKDPEEDLVTRVEEVVRSKGAEERG